MPEYDLTPEPPSDAHGRTVLGTVPCTGCGYDLRGLPISGACPECGRAVELSLRGDQLHFASPEYIRRLDLGLCIILTAIFLYVFFYIAAVPLATFINPRSQHTAFRLISSGLTVLSTLVFIAGYWLFTQPDPGFTGIEKAHSARIVARIAACVQAAAKLGAFMILLVGGSIAPGGTGGASIVTALGVLCKFVDYAAWATLFFAIVLYVRWLARRIPDHALLKRTDSYMWLLPLLSTVGLIGCLGPLISLILYASMLQSLRTRTKAIHDWQLRGGQTTL
jgi:hypothetical protein